MALNISLKGKVALVSGGGAGIGRGIVDEFAAIGADLVIAELKEDKCAALREAYPDALVVQADVCKQADVDALKEAVEKKFGRLDVLVNNVGHHYKIRKTMVEQTDEDIQRIYDINLRHMFLMCRALIPLMQKSGEGGSIINLSSIEGFRGFPYNVIYTTFKHAVTGLTRGLATELAPDGIRVNCIAPETTQSEQVPLDRIMKDPAKRAIADRSIPLGRFGVPKDHAGAAVFLATEMSTWVTGSCILVDGGGWSGNVFQRTPSGRWTNMPIVVGDAPLGPES